MSFGVKGGRNGGVDGMVGWDVTLNDWIKVSWSDECTIERGVGIKPIWTFTRPRDQIKERDIQPVRVSGKGVKKML